MTESTDRSITSSHDTAYINCSPYKEFPLVVVVPVLIPSNDEHGLRCLKSCPPHLLLQFYSRPVTVLPSPSRNQHQPFGHLPQLISPPRSAWYRLRPRHPQRRFLREPRRPGRGEIPPQRSVNKACHPLSVILSLLWYLCLRLPFTRHPFLFLAISAILVVLPFDPAPGLLSGG